MNRDSGFIPIAPFTVGEPADEAVEEPPTAADVAMLRRAFGVMMLHRKQDLYVAPTGAARDLQNLIMDRLIAERFSDPDAGEWAYRD